MTALTSLALRYQCPWCKQPADQWCVTTKGNPAKLLHAHRMYPVEQAHSEGWIEGRKKK